MRKGALLLVLCPGDWESAELRPEPGGTGSSAGMKVKAELILAWQTV